MPLVIGGLSLAPLLNTYLLVPAAARTARPLGGPLAAEGLVLRILPVLGLALVLTAVHYHWPQVVGYSLGITLVQLGLRLSQPNPGGTLISATAKLILTVRFAVFTEATLAFRGLSDPTTISCRTMLQHAFDDPLLFSRPLWPWLVLPPAAAIVLLVLGTVWFSQVLNGWRTRATRIIVPGEPTHKVH